MNGPALAIRPYMDEDREHVVTLWHTCFPNDPPWNEPEIVIRRKKLCNPISSSSARLATASYAASSLGSMDSAGGCTTWLLTPISAAADSHAS